jgi:glycine cleavage system H lipoate-binding protein
MVAIFVVLTFLVLVIADLVVQHYRAPQHVAAIPHPFEPAVAPGLFYDSGHTWTEVLASGRVRIGVDAFIGCALERTAHIEVLATDHVQRGEPLLALEAAGQRLVLPAPLSGSLTASNDVPPTRYLEKSWCCELLPEHLAGELGRLKIAEEASAWMRREIGLLKDWLVVLHPAGPAIAMQDGGDVAEGFLARVDSEAWLDFQQHFIDRT